MAGTVGHMQPCLRVPRVHGRRGSGQGEWQDTEGPGGGGSPRSSLGSSASPSQTPWVSLRSPADTGQRAEGVCSCLHSRGHLQTAHARQRGTRQTSLGWHPPAPL